MKDYSKKSDFEVNHEVAMLWLKDYRYEYYQHGTCDGVEVYSECGFVDRYDYCNNPSDAWPIIHGNDIMLNPNCADELWKAEQGFREKPSGFYGVATAYNKNPLRAAMIVYLMMKDGEK